MRPSAERAGAVQGDARGVVSVSELNEMATGPWGPSAPDQPTRKPEPPIEVNAEFRQALSAVEAGVPITFVTGGAGVGKSTYIRHLAATTKLNLAVVAPTGIAALNASGTTIHRFFGFPPRPVDLDSIRKSRNRTLFEKLQLLVIDEVSMVRADLLDGIDRALRVNREVMGQPFGGVQVVLVGDLFQLPPIVATEEEAHMLSHRYRSPFFFSAAALQASDLLAVEFSRPYRQSDPQFLRLLQGVREGRDTEIIVREINAACPAPANGEDVVGWVTLACTNAQAGAKNAAELARLEGPTRLFEGTLMGRFAVQKDKLPAPFHLNLKVGAQVMFVRNDSMRRWVNGTIGRVTDFGLRGIQVEVDDGAGAIRHWVDREVWETLSFEYDPARRRVASRVIGSFTQFPLMLAWAVTIHKSQGCTLDRAIIDLGNGAFASGQAYVALSRCRSLGGIRLARPIRESDIRPAPEVVRFYDALRDASGARPSGAKQAFEEDLRWT